MFRTKQRREPPFEPALLPLVPGESEARIDADRIVALYSELGETGAEAVICRAMEELAAGLDEVQRLVRSEMQAAAQGRARSLSRIADQIGMTGFAGVSASLAACLARGDDPASAAVLARLVRLGDRALTRVWDMRDLFD